VYPAQSAFEAHARWKSATEAHGEPVDVTQAIALPVPYPAVTMNARGSMTAHACGVVRVTAAADGDVREMSSPALKTTAEQLTAAWFGANSIGELHAALPTLPILVNAPDNGVLMKPPSATRNACSAVTPSHKALEDNTLAAVTPIGTSSTAAAGGTPRLVHIGMRPAAQPLAGTLHNVPLPCCTAARADSTGRCRRSVVA
jgi:hypothetical protein